MFRKLALGLAAAVTLGAAALAPGSASAGGGVFFPHHHHHHPHLFIAPAPILVAPPVIPPGCFQKRLVQTWKGLRWRTVNVCAY